MGFWGMACEELRREERAESSRERRVRNDSVREWGCRYGKRRPRRTWQTYWHALSGRAQQAGPLRRKRQRRREMQIRRERRTATSADTRGVCVDIFGGML